MRLLIGGFRQSVDLNGMTILWETPNVTIPLNNKNANILGIDPPRSAVDWSKEAISCGVTRDPWHYFCDESEGSHLSIAVICRDADGAFYAVIDYVLSAQGVVTRGLVEIDETSAEAFLDAYDLHRQLAREIKQAALKRNPCARVEGIMSCISTMNGYLVVGKEVPAAAMALALSVYSFGYWEANTPEYRAMLETWGANLLITGNPWSFHDVPVYLGDTGACVVEQACLGAEFALWTESPGMLENLLFVSFKNQRVMEAFLSISPDLRKLGKATDGPGHCLVTFKMTHYDNLFTTTQNICLALAGLREGLKLAKA